VEDSGVREIRNCRELKITPARWRKDNKKFKKERGKGTKKSYRRTVRKPTPSFPIRTRER
jgi:hypothetical protein